MAVQSQYLWKRAFKALEIRDPELVAAYACHLDPTRSSSTTPTARTLSPELVEAVIKKILQDNEAKKLVFHLGTKSIKVREQGEKIIKFILWSNDFISKAVSAQPYAALAWSGVSILLPLLLNSSKQKGAMLTGLNSITDLLRLYKIREELYLQAADKPAHPDFVAAIVELYADVIEYQATTVFYLSQNSFIRGMRSTFERDDWSGMLERIQSSNARCTEYITLVDKDRESRFYTEQSFQIEQSVEVQKRILEMFEAFQDTRQQDRRDDKESEMLRTLASDYKTDKDSISTRVPGTCEWVFEDRRFLDWRDNKRSSLLWISAGPGCGKSVLSRCLIDEKRLCTNVMTSTICYFFFKDGEEQRSKGSQAISAILHQLFEKKSGSSLLTHALSRHRKFGEKLLDAFSELWDILVTSAKDQDAGEVVCVIDALDECEEKARKQLVEKLVGFFLEINSLRDTSLILKFLVTSRPYEDLELGFEPISNAGTFMRFDGDEKSERIGQDINLVIDAKLPYIARGFNAEDRKIISDRLKSLDNRTYLWLFLTLSEIERFRSKFGTLSRIKNLLSSLPSSVSDAYQKILDRSSDKETAEILLQIIVAVRRPLSLVELNIALSITTAQRESSKSHQAIELWPPSSFKSDIQNMCGLFINVYDSKVFLIHQTAREFLLASSKSPRSWEGSLSMTMAHGRVSQICLHYLNLQDFASIPREERQDQYNDPRSLEEQYPFLDYAAKEWAFHYNSQDIKLAQTSRKDAGMLCRISRAQISYWSPIYRESNYQDFFDDWTELSIASSLGLIDVVEDLLNEGTDVNCRGFYDKPALIAASERGHEKIVEMLLSHNANVNFDITFVGTALIAASAEGHEEIVEILLSQNANVNAESDIGATALIEASIRGHEKIVEMLLSHNANVNAESKNDYGTALIAASSGEYAEGGYEKIVEMLLSHNANVNAESKSEGTALIAASMEGHEKIVEMLLSHNANVNAESKFCGTALIAASSGGHEKIVEMLLSHNANVNAKSKSQRTALIAASREGHEKIVEMLLSHNANVNAKSERFGTALIGASLYGHEKIVEMLLSHNANVNAESKNDYGTALIAASSGGHEKIVEMLLSHNANVNAEGERFGTALIGASLYGHEKIVEMLLSHNANVNAESKSEGTALIAASREGHEKIVEMLLSHNANVNAESKNDYGTALIAASSGGHEKIVEMLLSHNANVNAEGERFGTALIGASLYGHEKIVEMLLSHNANVNAESESKGTALIAASAKGHEKIVEMLLSQNANVNAESERFGTALIVASRKGYEKIVEMLLSQNANVNFESKRCGTALIAASTEGHENIAEMLLRKKADVNAESGPYNTALIAAAGQGHEKIVEMLWSQKADVDVKSEMFGTALIAASRQGHGNIVEMLLRKNADVNAESESQSPALIAASAKGHQKIVGMLLSQNADVNAESESQGTALIAASAKGHEKIVEMLLRKNANVDAESERQGTALIAASSEGHEKIVGMLLSQNANVNAESERFGTALIVASREGYEKIVEMLLSQNANVNAESESQDTALVAASAEGHEKVVTILLDWKATAGMDVALERASAKGQEKMIEILIKRFPDLNLNGECFRNALEKGSRNLQIRSVEVLLNTMLDSSVEVEVYGSALEVALKAATFKEDESEYSNTIYEEDWDGDENEYSKRIHEDSDENENEYSQRKDALLKMLMERKRNLSTRNS